MTYPGERHRDERSRKPWAAFATAVGAVSLCAVAACSSSSRPVAEHTAGANPQPKAIYLVPNLSGFLLNATTCRNGGPRPCAIAIRTEPELSAPYVNGFPDQHISWPLEAYAGEPGDPVKVECVRTDGQPVSDYLGDPPSPDWYEVQVPAEYAHNPQVRLGYAAIVWFGEQEPAADVPVCVGN